ncbi:MULTISPECIES: cation diffusion facilitator family transporter [Bacillus amyloliquefaciens group]|uniref:cation diffusion facilitator family transporter n=1 Tax=Bacillus amyloliquefaciens group TaxID=1938374 RepID=UPI0013639D2A|nr:MULTISPECIES: cation diffusion facilitator family transporter [Bacillus amyloliquefaciens group]MBO3651366.1 cation transporter [Bacillus amyloliquefaciens]MCJ2173240.1 cation diffusion facilitator family transporter [Bacillus amyloliquefaciens]MCR4348962.1 cation diffusion facilitator family transporter [Bacillus amyloliquefaciens]MCR4356001.1 cation diffusion facilitator family transporter [Bacillus amyloliquefaciens]MEC1479917.1 cation diffusion facilitator family transporter [Bacillus v
MENTSKIAFLSVISNSLVVMLKIVVGIITGSVAILSEAIHSFLDLIAAFIAFISVRISKKPADTGHPYGHGKVENLSGTIETILIFAAGIWMIYECVQKLVNPAPVHLPVLGIVVMLAGALINLIVSKFVKREAEKVNSVAMKSNALHLLTDVYTSLGVAASLLVVTLTEWYILDPIIGMVLAVYIIYEAFKLMKEAFPPLIDTRLSEEEEKTILKIIETFQQEFIEIHDFRTRRSGPQEYIDFHMVVASHVTIKDVHDLCDRIERDITNEFKQAQVMIHPEPESERKK